MGAQRKYGEGIIDELKVSYCIFLNVHSFLFGDGAGRFPLAKFPFSVLNQSLLPHEWSHLIDRCVGKLAKSLAVQREGSDDWVGYRVN